MPDFGGLGPMLSLRRRWDAREAIHSRELRPWLNWIFWFARSDETLVEVFDTIVD